MDLGLFRSSNFVFIITVLWILAGCQPPKSDPAPLAQPQGAVAPEVVKDKYLSGKAFCEKYKEERAGEIGEYVAVPKDYNDPSKGKVNLFIYGYRKIDPAKNAIIFVDGGPGQNTHGESSKTSDMSGMLEINHLRFDQRGVGCSAPETFQEYMASDWYSSENTAKDIEEIRKHYGFKSISVYGVSYGTVPATLYGQLFPSTTTSVVLEGVVGSFTTVSDSKFVVEKLNLVLSTFNPSQLAKFAEIWAQKESAPYGIVKIAFQYALYQDNGFTFAKKLLHLLIKEDGSVNSELVEKLSKSDKEGSVKEVHPQAPGNVDSHIQAVLYCKDLGFSKKDGETYEFSNSEQKFEVATIPQNAMASYCFDEKKIDPESVNTFDVKNIKVTAPVYYFQGTHDGATEFYQALDHWKFVPQNKSYFVISIKGGHNPMYSKIDNTSNVIRFTDSFLIFRGAIFAHDISKLTRPISKTPVFTTVPNTDISSWHLLDRKKDLNKEAYEKYTEGISYPGI